jgi:hypothetical protein
MAPAARQFRNYASAEKETAGNPRLPAVSFCPKPIQRIPQDYLPDFFFTL